MIAGQSDDDRFTAIMGLRFHLPVSRIGWPAIDPTACSLTVLARSEMSPENDSSGLSSATWQGGYRHLATTASPDLPSVGHTEPPGRSQRDYRSSRQR
jgi:hypothetical protein